MRLLFINAFKGLKKKKIQMAGIIVMVMLSAAVFVGMNTAIDRLEERYYDYLEEQNVEYFSFAINIDYTKDISNDDINYLLEHNFKDATKEEKTFIESYRQFIKNPKYDLQMLMTVQELFKKYEADSYIGKRKVEPLTKKYDFTYELERSKTIKDATKMLKVIPYSKDNKINKTYLVEGNYPKKEGEVTILPGYAKENKLSIGDKYKISDKEYKIVGFTYAPDYIYPLISFSMPIFDEKNNDIVFMYGDDYEDISGIVDNSYALSFNYKTDRKFKMSYTKEDTEDPMVNLLTKEEKSITIDMNTVTRIGRIGALQLEFESDRLFAQYFLYLLLAISVLIIVVITKKRIDDERLQIGVLKSLGYNKFSIATSYLVYPIVGSLIGGIIGYLIGIAVNGPLANVFLSFYCVPLANYTLSLKYLSTALFLPMILLSVLSYLIALFMLKKKPLQLLREGSNLKVNMFSKIGNKITKLLPFDYRFKYSLAFRSFGKLLIVTLTSFCTGLLITLILIGSNLFNKAIDESFKGISYKYMVALNGIDKKDMGEYSDTDYSLMSSVPLQQIKDKNNKVKEKFKDEDETFSLNGYDLKTNFVELLDNKDKNILPTLKDDNSIIVSENSKEVYNLEIGDKLVFKYQDLSFEYTVSGFNKEFMGTTGYVNRKSLSNKLGFDNTVYNVIYSNNKKYNDLGKLDSNEADKINMVLSVNDLKSNIKKQMDRFNGSIYFVILFASVMTLIIIAVIANIVVEENKKTISLLKVMGYKNKRISNIVLNIYTPFIVFAYLLSIPVMINILKAIVKALTGDIKVTIPITISPYMALLGLIGLVIAYYIAIAFSKRVLNKIPLAVALKRE